MMIDTPDRADEWALSWVREASPSRARSTIGRHIDERVRMALAAESRGLRESARTDWQIVNVLAAYISESL